MAGCIQGHSSGHVEMAADAAPGGRLVDSRAAWQAAVLAATERAVAGGARRLWWFDESFADWPLDQAGLHEVLMPWLRLPQRRLVLLASSYAGWRSRQPRFVAWRRDWSHAIDTLRWPEADAERPAALPTSVLVDDRQTVLVLHDRLHWRGRLHDSSAESQATAAALRQTIDALAQRSAPDLPPTELGL
jgi:hypothetical protein